MGNVRTLPEGWEQQLETLQGTVKNGQERVLSAMILDMLGVATEQGARTSAGKRIVSVMRRLGWRGPKTFGYGDVNGTRRAMAGYWRLPRGGPTRAAILEHGGSEIIDGELPDALEAVTRQGLRKLMVILRHDVDMGDSARTRNQVTAAGIAVNAQLRADEQRLRAKVTGDVLERLLRVIEAKRLEMKGEIPVAAELSTGYPQAGAETDAGVD